MESSLEVLESHFTWDLNASRSRLFRVRDQLEDIGSEEGYSWLGHTYNLQGFVHHQLGLVAEARRFFCRATEAFRQMRNTVSDQGPWLVVNFGNLAWLHHLLGEEAQSRYYLSEASALMGEFPSPCPGEPHPEVCAEKAWTLMKFDQQLRAADLFQRAVRVQPDMVEWQSSRVLAAASAFHPHMKTLGADIVEKMKIAKEHDPDNLYVAAVYLEARAARGEEVEEEARALARRVLRKPVSSYSGISPLLRLYRRFISIDEAIDLAEEALERHPDARYVRRCAATCYRRRVLNQSGDHERSVLDRAVSLCQEVIALYPHSALSTRIHLAGLHSRRDPAEADRIFRDLLDQDLDPDLDPEGAQMLYNCYAKFLHVTRKDTDEAIDKHMMAAAIPQPSSYRHDSILILRKITETTRNRRCGEIREFLAHLQL